MYADETFPLANDAVEFVTMLLLNKHYVEHSHVPTLHGQRKDLMHLVNNFYPDDDFASVMAKAHKKTNVIHSVFMGREHRLFRGGVVTKAVGVCVDGCQYRPRVHKTRAKKRRHKLSAQADVQAEAVSGVLTSLVVDDAVGRSAATPSVSSALSNHSLLRDLSAASGLSPSLFCDDALGCLDSSSLSSPLSRFAPPP